MVHSQNALQLHLAFKIQTDKPEAGISEGHIGKIHQLHREVPQGVVVGGILGGMDFAAAFGQAFSEADPYRDVIGMEGKQPDAAAHLFSKIQNDIAALLKNSGCGFGKSDLQGFSDAQIADP